MSLSPGECQSGACGKLKRVLFGVYSTIDCATWGLERAVSRVCQLVERTVFKLCRLGIEEDGIRNICSFVGSAPECTEAQYRSSSSQGCAGTGMKRDGIEMTQA